MRGWSVALRCLLPALLAACALLDDLPELPQLGQAPADQDERYLITCDARETQPRCAEHTVFSSSERDRLRGTCEHRVVLDAHMCTSLGAVICRYETPGQITYRYEYDLASRRDAQERCEEDGGQLWR